MLKKTIKYTDFDGVEHEEDFYFNLSRAELIDMETSVTGGFTKKLESIAKTSDASKIMPIFKDLILRSYGVKSDDGKRFIKSPEMALAFEQSEAYSELVMELLTNSDSASVFMNSIMNVPPEALEEAKKKANISALPTVSAAK